MTRPKPPAPDQDDATGAALVGLGLGLLVYSCAGDELRARIVAAIRGALLPRPAPPRPPAIDLGAKHPGAIDV